MACSLKCGISVSVSVMNETFPSSKDKSIVGFCSSRAPPSQVRVLTSKSISKILPAFSIHFKGQSLAVSDHKSLTLWHVKAPNKFSINAQASICVSRAMRWWEKTLKPNMIEIQSAQELVDALRNGGDRLVILDFYSPGCGGCKSLHPKICQLAELNPNAIFLKVNYEELKTMCHSLHIHVLPFFKFYRGSEGHLCSFSCTNATIKKFKDALAKHGTDRCSLGPAKGLDESELLKLASINELSINLPLPSAVGEEVEDLVMQSSIDLSGILSKAGENKTALQGEGVLL
ncbi:hypothetical protein CISIN_1g023089mg [Citrus sinensis]|uniref:Thioredoxin domain-containing protein n=1 Tax=Citrus sinensis TaxID=2711 RepID=A0A067ENR9_CITSI|nr:hypothetical protein CISIN_1g023089mg [Citrus sinensis]